MSTRSCITSCRFCRPRVCARAQEVRCVPCFTQALQYIHGERILHRDLKTSNLFLMKSKSAADQMIPECGCMRCKDCTAVGAHFVSTVPRKVVKLGDFGISRVLEGSIEAAVWRCVEMCGVWTCGPFGPFGPFSWRGPLEGGYHRGWNPVTSLRLSHELGSLRCCCECCRVEVLHVPGGVRKQAVHLQERCRKQRLLSSTRSDA